MDEKEEYKILNDKIINILEDLYLKSFRKEVKKFQIVAAGYNAIKRKNLQFFNKYWWNVYPSPGVDHNNSSYTFGRRILPKMLCWFTVTYNDEMNILASENISKGYITLGVDKEDILYNLVRQLDIMDFYRHTYGKESLNYSIRSQIDKYYLDILVKFK